MRAERRQVATVMDWEAARKRLETPLGLVFINFLATMIAVGIPAWFARIAVAKSEGSLVMNCRLIEVGVNPIPDEFHQIRFDDKAYPANEVGTWEVEILSERQTPIRPDDFFEPALTIPGGTVVKVRPEQGVSPRILWRQTSSGVAFGRQVINYGDRSVLTVFVHSPEATSAWAMSGKFAGVRVEGTCIEGAAVMPSQEDQSVLVDQERPGTGFPTEQLTDETEAASDIVCSGRTDDSFGRRLAGWQVAGGRLDRPFLIALLRSTEPRSISIFFSTDSPVLESANFWHVKERELQRNISRIASTGGVVTILSGTRLAGREDNPVRENSNSASLVASYLRDALGDHNTRNVRLKHITVLPSLTLSRSDLRLAGVNVDDERVAGQAAGELVSVVFEGC